MTAPSIPNAAAAQPPVDWRRLHKITPLLNAWKVAVVLIGVFVWQYADTIGELDLAAGTILLIVVGAVVGGSLIGLGYSALAWRMTRYGIGADSVFLHSGVLFRQQRHVRLDRLQTIDVSQPLLARLFGFAQLKIESAGGAGSNLTLAYLSETDAQNLRNELLARAAGVTVATAADGAPPVLTPAAPEREVLALTPGRLVGSLALSFVMILILIGVVALVVAAVGTHSFAPILGVGPAGLGAVAYFWGRFSGEFAFRVATSPDGIRVRQGLLESKARTIPPGRVQAIKISQPLLWRLKGWWRVQVNIAGYGAEETTGSVLYPAGTAEEVARVLYLVLPDLGDNRPLELLATGMTGTGEDEGFVTSPRRSRWLDWITWRRNGFRVTDTAILLRSGRIWRHFVLVPHERTQSLGLTQGPIERRLDLVNFELHSTPGQIIPSIQHLDAAVARELLVEQADRARRARRLAGPEHWMRARTAPGAGSTTGAQTTPGTFGGILPSPSPDQHFAPGPASAGSVREVHVSPADAGKVSG
ncbi:MAG: PH domain-containing protein [Actinomycetales bacterium]|nr:PH domain-containing protein [Actinomycetales bacterium]